MSYIWVIFDCSFEGFCEALFHVPSFQNSSWDIYFYLGHIVLVTKGRNNNKNKRSSRNIHQWILKPDQNQVYISYNHIFLTKAILIHSLSIVLTKIYIYFFLWKGIASTWQWLEIHKPLTGKIRANNYKW